MRPSADSRASSEESATTWWFVRHGQSVANADRWLAGHRDAALTDLGRREARALRPRLRGAHPSRVYSSDLVRARETADLAFPTQPAEPHFALRERHLGTLEGSDIAPLRDSGAMDHLLTWNGRPQGGESQHDLAVRVLTWIADHDTGESTMLFVHGGLIRVVVGLHDGTPTDRIGLWKVKNTEIAERRIPKGRWAQLLAEIQ